MIPTEAADHLQDCAKDLATARVEEAESFRRHRALLPTDNQARAAAVIETQSQLDLAQANYEIAVAYLKYAVAEAAREG